MAPQDGDLTVSSGSGSLLLQGGNGVFFGGHHINISNTHDLIFTAHMVINLVTDFMCLSVPPKFYTIISTCFIIE